MSKSKTLGQIFTPHNIVKTIINQATPLLNKTCMDNSCGDGAFIVDLLDQHLKEYANHNEGVDGFKQYAQQHIMGIEVDKNAYEACVENCIKWSKRNGFGEECLAQIIHADTLDEYVNHEGKIDVVVGNPPYVRTHNLTGAIKNKISQLSPEMKGMTDLYLAFFIITERMLTTKGQAHLIAPTSLCHNSSAQPYRKHLRATQKLHSITTLGHYNPFAQATTYTNIYSLTSSPSESVTIKTLHPDGKTSHLATLPNGEMFCDNANMDIVATANPHVRRILSQPFSPKLRKMSGIAVKNGFATLADSVFVSPDVEMLTQDTIPAVKATTGKQRSCVFPYDKDTLRPLSYEELSNQTASYLEKHKARLESRSIDSKTVWFLFGRSQAISDVNSHKMSINNIVRCVDDVRPTYCPPGVGVYGGLYVLFSDDDLHHIENVKKLLRSQGFIDYVQGLGKYKNGGYYTFNGKDVELFLIYSLPAKVKEGNL